MNKMIEFAEVNRTTTYFRDYAIAQIRIAYRIMEYLAPDDIFPPNNLNESTKALIMAKCFEDAAVKIIDNEVCICCDSSCGSETLIQEAVKLMEYLYESYCLDKLMKKEVKRQELSRQLKELDKED